jgi:hypothetical protein
VSGDLTREQLADKFGTALATGICALSPGAWQPFDTEQELLLVRLNQMSGGLPSGEVLRPRLVVDWTAFMRKQAVQEATQRILARYRFVEER